MSSFQRLLLMVSLLRSARAEEQICKGELAVQTSCYCKSLFFATTHSLSQSVSQSVTPPQQDSALVKMKKMSWDYEIIQPQLICQIQYVILSFTADTIRNVGTYQLTKFGIRSVSKICVMGHKREEKFLTNYCSHV